MTAHFPQVWWRVKFIIVVNQINITADPDVCENLDDMACTRFKASKHDVCSDTCFATNVCPRMCGKCCKYIDVSLTIILE